MTDRKHSLTRRDFLRGGTGLTLATAAGLSALSSSSEGASTRSRSKVVLVRDRNALNEDGTPNAAVLPRMLDDAVTALMSDAATAPSGNGDPAAAWKKLIRPDDVVGIKTNVWRFLRTPLPLEAAIERRLIDAGVARDRIGIDDRGVRRNPLFRRATALVNIRPMRTHHWSGVGSLIKNYIMFHPEPPRWHEDSCANLAGLWDMPEIRGKTRLNILVMLTPLFHSKGPHNFQASYTWPYRGLLVGVDPVAVDATGLRILEAKRREFFGKDMPFPIPPKHIRVAQDRFGLGIADPARIDLEVIGWKDGLLIQPRARIGMGSRQGAVNTCVK